MQKPTPPNLDELVSSIISALPGGLQALKHDTEKNLHAALRAALAKMNLVTREEFDVQQAVLSRSRAKLEELEKKVEALEKKLAPNET